MTGWEGSFEFAEAARAEAVYRLGKIDPGCEACEHSVVCPHCGEAVWCSIHGEIENVYCEYEDFAGRANNRKEAS